MIKAIIFDYYGVLTTDAYLMWLGRHPELVERHATAIKNLSQDQDKGISADEFYSRLAKISGEEEAAVQAEFAIHGVEHHGLLDYIRHLRRLHLKTAVLSNADTGLYDEIAAHHISHLFNLILCSGEAGITKPHPKIFRMALERLNVEPHEALFVDDRDYNVRGAQAAGLGAVTYTGLADLRRSLRRLGID